MISLLNHEIKAYISHAHWKCSLLRELMDKEDNSPNSCRFTHLVNSIEYSINQIDFVLECFNVLKASKSFLSDKQCDLNIYMLLVKQRELLQNRLIGKGLSFSIRVSDDIVHNTVYATNYYSTAICGILNHALQSACFGSTIICSLFSNCLEVSYVGINIPDLLIISIFKDNYVKHDFINSSLGKIEFGLFAAKRILDASGSFLSVRSEPLYERNIYAEILMAEYLNSLSEAERYTFIHKYIPESDYSEVENIYKRIMNNRYETYEKEYLNSKFSLSDHIHDYYGMDSLINFEDCYMSESISKAKITIYYGKAKRHIVD